MQKILLFLAVLSWVASVASAITIAFSIWFGIKYEGSVEEMVDRIKGYKRDYFAYLGRMVLIFIISVTYLITYYS